MEYLAAVSQSHTSFWQPQFSHQLWKEGEVKTHTVNRTVDIDAARPSTAVPGVQAAGARVETEIPELVNWAFSAMCTLSKKPEGDRSLGNAEGTSM